MPSFAQRRQNLKKALRTEGAGKDLLKEACRQAGCTLREVPVGEVKTVHGNKRSSFIPSDSPAEFNSQVEYLPTFLYIHKGNYDPELAAA